MDSFATRISRELGVGRTSAAPRHRHRRCDQRGNCEGGGGGARLGGYRRDGLRAPRRPVAERRYNGNEPVEIDNTALESYHCLGGVGSESVSSDASDPQYGGIFEFRPADDTTVISVFSSRDPTPQRGLVVLDVSDFTCAESKAELGNAGITVLSFVRNDNGAAAWIDAKISDDGKYAFVSQQPYSAAFGEPGAA